MTLHITQGLLLTGAAADPFTLAAQLREVGLRVATDTYWSLVAQRAVQHVDRVRAGLAPSVHIGRYDTLAEQVMASVQRDVGGATKDMVHRNPHHDLGVTVKVLRAAGSDALLGIVSAELGTYHAAFTRLTGVEDYSWYSTETAPVPAARWDEHLRTWESSLRDGWRSDLGWTWSLFGTGGLVDLPGTDDVNVDALAAALPDDEDRAADLAAAFAYTATPGQERNLSAILSDFERAQRAALPKARTLIAPLTDIDWLMPLTARNED